METIDLVIVWTIGYLLTFVLFALLRRHLIDEAPANADSAPTASQSGQANHDGPESPGDEVADGQCPACGTPNDTFFTYCKRCLSQLDQHPTDTVSLT